MKRKVYISIAFILFVISGSGQTIKRIDGTIISFDTLQNKIALLMQDANVSGLCISVFNENTAVFKKAFGLANVPMHDSLETSTVLYGASFSKLMFAYIVMQLVQDKRIEIDRPLVEYLSKPLPDFKVKVDYRGFADLKDDMRYKKITARMCLNHTTGFPNWRWFEADEKLRIKFEPGTRYSYSGEGINLLQFVVEQITGKDIETIALERVFKPLGMTNTSYLWQKRFEENYSSGHDAKGNVYEIERWDEAGAAGSMSTSLDDYSRFFSSLLKCEVLSPESFKEMIKPQVRIKSRQQFGPGAWIDCNDNDAIELSYGLGAGVLKTPYGNAFFKEGHDEGWGHYSIGFPDKGIAIVIMTNNDNGESIFKEILEIAIGDVYTPWQWENYIPYNRNKQ